MPPSENVFAFLDELRNNLSSKFSIKCLCIIGDINIDTIKDNVSSVCDYLNLLADSGIENTIFAPTRVEFLGDKLVTTCIDHINVRVLDTLSVRSFVISRKLTDHYFICPQFSSLTQGLMIKPESRSIDIINRTTFNNLVSSYDWVSFLREVEPSEVYMKFV
ncbi:unnamed protein product [Ixodes pacificus]